MFDEQTDDKADDGGGKPVRSPRSAALRLGESTEGSRCGEA